MCAAYKLISPMILRLNYNFKSGIFRIIKLIFNIYKHACVHASVTTPTAPRPTPAPASALALASEHTLGLAHERESV